MDENTNIFGRALFEELNAQISNICERIASMEAAIRGLMENTNQQTDSLHLKFAEHQNESAEHKQEMEAVYHALDASITEIETGVKQEIKEIKQKVDAHLSGHASHKSDMKKLKWLFISVVIAWVITQIMEKVPDIINLFRM
jgi:chromosome segregation ATPase